MTAMVPMIHASADHSVAANVWLTGLVGVLALAVFATCGYLIFAAKPNSEMVFCFLSKESRRDARIRRMEQRTAVLEKELKL